MNRLIYVLTLLFLVLFTSNGLFAQETEEADKEQKTEKKDDKKKKSNKIYAIKDKYGNIVGYTDTPKKDSEEIVIQKGTEYSPPEVTNPYANAKAKVVETTSAYTSFIIASPGNDATVRNNAGNLQVAVDVRPRLLPGHKIILLVDGVVMAEGKSPIMSLTNVDRGSHALSAQIQSADGEIVKTTPSVTVHLHRAAVGRSN